MKDDNCLFCRIVSGEIAAAKVFEDGDTLVFLDHRPLFAGHSLVIPKEHFETLSDLPAAGVGKFFTNVQLLARAVEKALGAEGTFVAMNNKISQSVPHLHVHRRDKCNWAFGRDDRAGQQVIADAVCGLADDVR